MHPLRVVLVVDDDDDFRDTLVDMLRFEGFTVEAARNGQQGMDWLRGHGATPSVVLLDLMMPVMNGRAFLALKERDPSLVSVPVIVLTAGGDIHELRASGHQAFPKTAQLRDLLAAIAACD
jgi:CheY-like chemotaxis protein